MDLLPMSVDFVLLQADGVTSSPSKTGNKEAKQQAVEDRQLADQLAHLANAGNITLDVLAVGSHPHLNPCLSELCRGTGGSINFHSSESLYRPMLALPLIAGWLSNKPASVPPCWLGSRW